jgi:cell division protein FtsZ
LKDNVDTLLVISNDKLRHQFGNLKMKEAFGRADNVLATAAKCITDVINSTGQINVDFADVCTVMRGGGVAILGSAAAEGENRAQEAIENALTSPLLNDDEIKGAKWILININSAEGEHEFTMDEVEIIQNHLLSQAGEETDVILGLGYDNTLGNQIGITLIATGFHHKDPFSSENKIENTVENQKVVLKLEVQSQPSVSIPITSEIVLEEPSEKVIDKLIDKEKKQTLQIVKDEVEDDALMPTLSIDNSSLPEIKKEENNEPIFFEISSSVDQIPTTRIDLEGLDVNKVKEEKKELTKEITKNIEITATSSIAKESNLSSGSFLAKPAQIYAEEKPAIQESGTNENQLPMQPSLQEDEPETKLKLVIKETQNAAEEPVVQQTQPIMRSSVEEPALQDETEELRRRAMERIAKLRNLSFNANATDPNNEFETVPAYLRRNMDMTNQIADVESFYSAYTVKPSETNHAEISTINSFLDGKKPD